MSLLFLWDSWQRSPGPAVAARRPPRDAAARTAPPAATAPRGRAAQRRATPADASVPQPQRRRRRRRRCRRRRAPAAGAGVRGAAGRAGRASRPIVLRVEIDPAGAVLARAELLQQTRRARLDRGRTARRWSPARSRTATPTWCCSDVEPEPRLRRAERPDRRRRRCRPTARRSRRVDGPTRARRRARTQLEVKFVAESGGVRLTKTYTFRRGRYDDRGAARGRRTSATPPVHAVACTCS
ncbi:MAG: YidC/Oxa1 family insertase periplasmic domain-containing protein [Comamonadaceae bacterium]|nr:YidC/Oxa1 family insertase periplasmic domain-containing protein [Comamonadaceae bacterium]